MTIRYKIIHGDNSDYYMVTIADHLIHGDHYDLYIYIHTYLHKYFLERTGLKYNNILIYFVSSGMLSTQNLNIYIREKFR